MFNHPIRDLIVLGLIGWFVKRQAAKRGGWGKLFARPRTATASRR
jgi:hypothetical protein